MQKKSDILIISGSECCTGSLQHSVPIDAPVLRIYNSGRHLIVLGLGIQLISFCKSLAVLQLTQSGPNAMGHVQLAMVRDTSPDESHAVRVMRQDHDNEPGQTLEETMVMKTPIT